MTPLNSILDVFNRAPIARFAGLASDSKTRSIGNAERGIGRSMADAIQQQQSVLLARQLAYSSISTTLRSLEADANQYTQTSNLLPVRATSSDSSILGAAAGANAKPGTYSIVVDSLASSQVNLSADFASAFQPGLVSPGTFTVQVGTAAAESFTVDSTTTLLGLENTINASSSDLLATVVNDGTSYRLQVSGRDTGSQNTLAFTDSGTGLDLGDTQIQAAQNASISIDGASFVTSFTNTFTAAIDGVTLQAQIASDATQTVTVTTDTSLLAGAVEDIVNRYNGVQTAINAVSNFSGTYDPKSLIGDITLHNLQDELQSAIGPATLATTGWAALSELGVATQPDGTLRLNSSALQAAIGLNPRAVATALSNSADGATLGIAGELARVAGGYGNPITGILPQLNASITSEAKTTQDTVQNMQYAAGVMSNTLKNEFVALEKQMVLLRAQDTIVAVYANQVDADAFGSADAEQAQLEILADPDPQSGSRTAALPR